MRICNSGVVGDEVHCLLNCSNEKMSEENLSTDEVFTRCIKLILHGSFTLRPRRRYQSYSVRALSHF